MVHYEPLYKNMINDPRMDVYFADAFNQLYEEFGIRDDDYAEGSTDVGNVSQITRVSQPEICIGYDINAHTKEFARRWQRPGQDAGIDGRQGHGHGRPRCHGREILIISCR